MATDPDRLLAFIEETGLSYKENSVSFIFACPRCNKADKLYLRKRDGRFVCWVCCEVDGYRGNAEFALADLANRPLSIVKDFLYGASHAPTSISLGLQLSDFFGDDDIIDDAATVVPSIEFPEDYYPIDHEFAKRGVNYLADRGIDLARAMKYHLRYTPTKRRVVFPVELDDRLVGWQERAVFETHIWSEEKSKYIDIPKILSSKELPTASTVMFANNLKGSDHAVICEGPIDAIKAHLCKGNIATMGKAVSRGQIEFIRNRGVEKIYLALDPDACRESSRLVKEFSDLQTYIMTPPAPYGDIGEMGPNQVLDLFLKAQRVGPGRLYLFLGGH